MSTRRHALEALADITDNGAYANLRLKQAQAGLDARDASFVAASVYTALDNISYIDLAIAKYAKGKLDKTVRNILRLGVAQAMFMNVPESAACNESVKLAREVGKAALSGYINGVMRTVCREGMPPLPVKPVDRLSLQYAWPRFIIREYIARYGEDFTQALVAAKTPGMTVRAQHPYTSDELARELDKRGAPYSRGQLDGEAFRMEQGFDVASEALFQGGKLTVQSEGAMLACRALGAKPGMDVLDCCCAPGGKTAYIASLMGNTGSITGFELHEHRVNLTENTLRRLGVGIAHIVLKDATEPDPALYGRFDAVLTDVPCSGLGVAGKPDIRRGLTEAGIASLAETQSAILDVCSRYVKPGGRLVYSTCTVSVRENEAQADSFLNMHGEFSPVPDWAPNALRERINNGGVQLFQNIDGTDGFYIAVFERRA